MSSASPSRIRARSICAPDPSCHPPVGGAAPSRPIPEPDPSHLRRRRRRGRRRRDGLPAPPRRPAAPRGPAALVRRPSPRARRHVPHRAAAHGGPRRRVPCRAGPRCRRLGRRLRTSPSAPGRLDAALDAARPERHSARRRDPRRPRRGARPRRTNRAHRDVRRTDRLRRRRRPTPSPLPQPSAPRRLPPARPRARAPPRSRAGAPRRGRALRRLDRRARGRGPGSRPDDDRRGAAGGGHGTVRPGLPADDVPAFALGLVRGHQIVFGMGWAFGQTIPGHTTRQDLGAVVRKTNARPTTNAVRLLRGDTPIVDRRPLRRRPPDAAPAPRPRGRPRPPASGRSPRPDASRRPLSSLPWSR
jgi:hypothetical protein